MLRLQLASLLVIAVPVFAGTTLTSVSLTSSTNPSILGSTISLTASVSPSTATGSVTFYDGTTILKTEPLVLGQATLTTALLPSGTRNLKALYSGGSTYAGSLSTTLLQNVVELPQSGFLPDVVYGINCGVQSVAVADFNSDGIPDIVFNDGCGYGAYEVGLMLGNGDGTFQTPIVIYPAGTGALAVGDFNGDGKPDLFLSGTNSFVLLGNGDGTFQQPLPVAGSGGSALVADFNGDGKADVAINGSSVTTVMLGNGDGTFQPAVFTYNGGLMAVYFIAAGEFNNDGKVDIVLSRNVAMAAQELVVLLGDGDGTFQAQPAIATNFTPGSIAVADLNGDGNADLAVVNQNDSYPSVPGSIAIFLGKGDGTFQPPVAYSTGPSVNFPAPILIGDFNGDSKQDLIFAAIPYYTEGNLQALFGNGDGTFQPAVPFTSTFVGGAYAFAAADLNRDGREDVVAAQGSVGVFLGRALPICASASIAPIVVDANGGTVPLNISVTSDPCSWSLASTSPWITFNPSGGTGSSTATVTIAPNFSGLDQTGNLDTSVSARLAFVTPVAQKGTAEVFADVPPTAYYFDAVNLLSAKGITSGCTVSPLDFCPTEPIDRAEMAIFIVRSIFGGDNFTPPTTQSFNDVGPSDFGFAWIQEMYALGITTGCGNGDYCPDDTLTRAEAAIFVIRARYGATAVFDYTPIPFFTDVPANAFGFAWIQRMKMDNITEGCAPTLYCPADTVTRGEMAVFLMRGSYNQLLPSGEPVIAQITPATIPAGQTTNVTVTGANTSFSSATIVNPIPGVTIGSVNITSATTLTVALTPAANAVPESIWVTTGTEEAVLPNGLTFQ